MTTGCNEGGQEAFVVTGQVAFPDGTTLREGGYVLFKSIEALPEVNAYGHFGPEGKFEIYTHKKGDGLVAGNYSVAVIPTVPEKPGDMSEQEFLLATAPIDLRFQDTGTSGIRFEVSAEAAPNECNIEVTKSR